MSILTDTAAEVVINKTLLHGQNIDMHLAGATNEGVVYHLESSVEGLRVAIQVDFPKVDDTRDTFLPRTMSVADAKRQGSMLAIDIRVPYIGWREIYRKSL